MSGEALNGTDDKAKSQAGACCNPDGAFLPSCCHIPRMEILEFYPYLDKRARRLGSSFSFAALWLKDAFFSIYAYARCGTPGNTCLRVAGLIYILYRCSFYMSWKYVNVELVPRATKK